ncbi:MAG: hypothetical protein LLG04_01405 [Parachlamydia sp.]|nr:hypothetical protein [Parachlamydia sp.]
MDTKTCDVAQSIMPAATTPVAATPGQGAKAIGKRQRVSEEVNRLRAENEFLKNQLKLGIPNSQSSKAAAESA